MSLVQAPAFEALIVPYRSLTPKAIWGVVAIFLALTAGVAFRFWLWGAWPVVAFSFVDVPLFVVLLMINQRQARARELIMLDSAQLTVIRTDASGRRRQETLPAAWLRIDLDSANGSPRIVASSNGRNLEVGGFLHEADRMSLFESLESALHQVKNPRFDNPQLRDR